MKKAIYVRSIVEVLKMANKKEEKKTTLTITIDENVKNEFAEICEELGMSVSGAITIFAKQMIREGQLPFIPGSKAKRKLEIDSDNKAAITYSDLERFVAYIDEIKK